MEINASNGKAVEQAIQAIEIGDPVYHASLTVFPLFADQAAPMDHLILEEALASNLVEITEVSESGNVPELLLINRSDSKILLLDGEELVGAKQNRILNITILIAARMKVKIPVSCVEQGRWNYRSRTFDAGAFATTSMRSRTKAETMDSVRQNKTHCSDQGRVWDDVECMMNDMNVDSDTSAMHEAYIMRDNNLILPADANGYIACIGERVLGGDLFTRTDALRLKWPRLVKSLAMEAMSWGDDVAQTDASVAKTFLSQAATSIAEPYETPGIGCGVHIDGTGVIGNALLVYGEVLHVSMFRRA
jgi:hypothetical protein